MTDRLSDPGLEVGWADHTYRHALDAADGKIDDESSGWQPEGHRSREIHPIEAREIKAKYFEADPQKYRAILEGVAFADLKRNREYFGTRENPGPLSQVASRASEIWLKARTIPKAVREQDIIATDYVQGKDK